MSAILLKMKIPRPWHLEVYFTKLVRVSLSTAFSRYFAAFWITRKKWRISWASKRSVAESRTNLIMNYCLVCPGLACIFWDFCLTCLCDTARSSRESGWLLTLAAIDIFRKPSQFVTFNTTSPPSPPHRSRATNDHWVPCRRSYEKMFWIWCFDWVSILLRRIRVVLSFNIFPEVLGHLYYASYKTNYWHSPKFKYTKIIKNTLIEF